MQTSLQIFVLLHCISVQQHFPSVMASCIATAALNLMAMCIEQY